MSLGHKNNRGLKTLLFFPKQNREQGICHTSTMFTGHYKNLNHGLARPNYISHSQTIDENMLDVFLCLAHFYWRANLNYTTKIFIHCNQMGNAI